MLPLVGYILIGGTFSVGLHYYSMKGLSFAAAVSLFAGFFLCREKDRHWDSVVHGLAQYGNSRLIFVFMVIGIFSKLMNTGGIGDGFIWLSLKLGISRSGFVVFSFLASAMISMGAGAPIAAMFAVIPIFYPPGILLGANPAMLAGALISGIFFGDAISPSSQVINTTVMIQHDGVTGQPADLLKTLRMRTPYILAAGGAAMVVYLIFWRTRRCHGGYFPDISHVLPPGTLDAGSAGSAAACLFQDRKSVHGIVFAIVSGFAVGLLTGVLALPISWPLTMALWGSRELSLRESAECWMWWFPPSCCMGLIAVAVDGDDGAVL